MEPADQFYGDRHGGVKDRFGNFWWIATRVENVPRKKSCGALRNTWPSKSRPDEDVQHPTHLTHPTHLDMLHRLEHVFFVRSIQPFGVCAAVCADRGAARVEAASGHVAAGLLDSGVHGDRAQRGDGIQPARRRPVRRRESAHGVSRAAERPDVATEAIVFVVVMSLGFVAAAAQLSWLCFVLSPVALIMIFWYSLAKRYTWATQFFLGLAMAIAPVGGWLAAGRRGGWEPWLLGLAIALWVGGFDVLYACQDLDVDRRSI